MKKTENLTESISQNFVVQSGGSNYAFNAYWQYCKNEKIPFVAIRWNYPNKYATVILDMLTANRELDQEEFEKVEMLFYNSTRKKHSLFGLGSIRSQCDVLSNEAEYLAKSLYDVAIGGV